jgi:predicted nucleotide-binding protein (sugar kinase/HSP70/actin superfamily)
MCDHAHAIAAVFHYFGQQAEVMPQADHESAMLGVSLVLGRECTPCAYVAGDIIRRLRQPDIDPAHTTLFISTAEGPCRYGQYHVLLRHILDDHGFGAVKIIYPTAENSYRGFGEHPTAFRLLAWRAIVAVDLLQGLLLHHRPYALDKDEVARVYQTGLAQILDAVSEGGGRLRGVMADIGRAFRGLAEDRSTPRPLIGLVGEIYVRQHWPSNHNVIHQIEELGGEVILANMMEYLYYVNWWYIYKSRMHGEWREMLITKMTDVYQRVIEFWLSGPVADLLLHRFESRAGTLMKHTAHYMDPLISTEAVITIGKAVELAHLGASGILNVMPFTCMPGTMSAGLAPKVRADLHGIPWLDLSYDMQQTTNVQTRLEAFMYQATHFQRQQHATNGHG